VTVAPERVRREWHAATTHTAVKSLPVDVDVARPELARGRKQAFDICAPILARMHRRRDQLRREAAVVLARQHRERLAGTDLDERETGIDELADSTREFHRFAQLSSPVVWVDRFVIGDRTAGEA
jgi:hypothetical protein